MRDVSAFEATPQIQRALRLATSSVRYSEACLAKSVTAAWVMNNEIASESIAVDETKVRVSEVDSLVSNSMREANKKIHEQKIAQSTIDLARSKLESLIRAASDAGVDKNVEVQNAIAVCEEKFNFSTKRLEPTDGVALVQVINDAKGIMKKVATEQNDSIQKEEMIQKQVRDLVDRLTSICGLCDASGTLVVDNLQSLIQGARDAVHSAIRLSEREGGSHLVNSAITAANRAIAHLEECASTTKEEVAGAEKVHIAGREKLDVLTQNLRSYRTKVDSLPSEHRKTVSTLLSDADAALHLFRLHMQGVKSWLEEPTILEELLRDATNKVELAGEEVERINIVAQTAREEMVRLTTKQRQLQNRHEHVCTTVQYMKTATAPELVQAISATDRALSQVLVRNYTPYIIAELEGLVKAEEDVLECEMHNAEKRTIDMEKAATKIPIFQQKLASLEAKVDAAGVHVAAVVDAELGEARRAVRAIEHSLEAEMNIGTVLPLSEVDAKLKDAESAVTTQVRRISNATMAQQEAKTQLRELETSYDELNEEATKFSIFTDRIYFQSELEWAGGGVSASNNTTTTSPATLSKRIILNSMTRTQQLIAHARRRIDVPVSVWMEYGPMVAQNALECAQGSLREARLTVDSEQAKLDSNNTERKSSRAKLEDSAQNLTALRAQIESITDSADICVAQESIDAAEHAVDVALRALANGTIASSISAINVAQQKASEAEMLCTSAVKRSDRVKTERKNMRDQYEHERLKLDAAKESAIFLGICEVPVVADSLSMADRSLVAVDLILKCEFGLPMLRSEFQAATEAVQEFARIVEKEKSKAEMQQQLEVRKKYEERSRQQRRIAVERARSEEEIVKKREMQDKLDAAIHQLQLHWPAVVDVQNSMATAEAAVEVARQKLVSGGLPAAKAAVSMALSKIRVLNKTAIAIERTGAESNDEVGNNIFKYATRY